MSVKRIAVLTGGGDAPGLNAVIRAIVVTAEKHGIEVFGVRRGWAGLLDEGEGHLLSLEDVIDIHRTGGTIIGSSRTNPIRGSATANCPALGAARCARAAFAPRSVSQQRTPV